MAKGLGYKPKPKREVNLRKTPTLAPPGRQPLGTVGGAASRGRPRKGGKK